MPIRPYNDPTSMTNQRQNEWFEKSDYSQSDIDRFTYMKKGNRKNLWQFKLDMVNTSFNEIEWIINEERFVNRPDAIAYKFYENSKYWWIIAMKNDITDPFTELYMGRKILIPDLSLVKTKIGANVV